MNNSYGDLPSGSRGAMLPNGRLGDGFACQAALLRNGWGAPLGTTLPVRLQAALLPNGWGAPLWTALPVRLAPRRWGGAPRWLGTALPVRLAPGWSGGAPRWSGRLCTLEVALCREV